MWPFLNERKARLPCRIGPINGFFKNLGTTTSILKQKFHIDNCRTNSKTQTFREPLLDYSPWPVPTWTRESDQCSTVRSHGGTLHKIKTEINHHLRTWNLMPALAQIDCRQILCPVTEQCWRRHKKRTIELRKDNLVSIPENGQWFRVDMHVGEVRDEVIAEEVPHEDPIIDYPLQVVWKRDGRLKYTKNRLRHSCFE